MATTKTKVSEMPLVGNIDDFEVMGIDRSTNRNARANMTQLRGNVGPKGEDGANGKDGVDGRDGSSGSDGASAYQIAVNEGFVGNESEWLASLHGKDGEDGSDGEDGAPGKTPVFETGTIETGEPGTDVIASITPNGTTEDGSPLYLIDMAIPQGMPGDGSGNVFVNPDALLRGAYYLFSPNGDGSPAGSMVNLSELGISFTAAEGNILIASGDTLPVIFGKTLTWLASLKGLAFRDSVDWNEHIDNRPNLSTVATTGSYNDLEDRPPIPSQEYIDSADQALDQKIGIVSDGLSATNVELSAVRAIAEGATVGFVFKTKAEMDAWLAIPENVAKLRAGYHLLIEELSVPDYWWTGTDISELETQKVDLSQYPKRDEMNTALTAKANDNEVVKLAGAQTIAGAKTFSVSPVVPAPTTDTQAAPKKYVDDATAFSEVSKTGSTGTAEISTLANRTIYRFSSPVNQVVISSAAAGWGPNSMAHICLTWGASPNVTPINFGSSGVTLFGDTKPTAGKPCEISIFNNKAVISNGN